VSSSHSGMIRGRLVSSHLGLGVALYRREVAMGCGPSYVPVVAAGGIRACGTSGSSKYKQECLKSVCMPGLHRVFVLV
jgi:hypothetical protein